MIKRILIVYISTFIISYGWSQTVLQKKSTPVTQSSTQGSTEVSAGGRAGGAPNGSGTVTNALQDVLFATNEDCDLYINEEFKSTVTKSQHKYLKLAPGRYTYKAKSKSTADELKESFSVREADPNEVFIDLLYVVDEKKQEREELQNKAKTGGTPLAQNNKESIGPEKQEKKTEINNEIERAVINTLLSNMIAVNGGNFIMGNNKAPSTDETEHPVIINSMLFSKYEVTQQQWEIIMGYNPSMNKDCSNCPVENVSWEEVMKFIRKINVTSNKKFRLPTEAEWEYVAKMGGKAEIDKAGGPEEFIKKTAWYFGNADKKTHAVGQKQPNIAGIYDLMGNVSEWCSDWYGSGYYKEENNQKNPEGPPLGKEKVVRGGSYNDYSGDRFRPSLRNKLKPTAKSGDIGFRLVMEVK